MAVMSLTEIGKIIREKNIASVEKFILNKRLFSSYCQSCVSLTNIIIPVSITHADTNVNPNYQLVLRANLWQVDTEILHSITPTF